MTGQPDADAIARVLAEAFPPRDIPALTARIIDDIRHAPPLSQQQRDQLSALLGSSGQDPGRGAA